MPAAIAIEAHPDDIEFHSAGTLLLLKQRGWDIHYMTLSDGNMGSTVMSAVKTAATRRKEARAAAKLMGATWHAPVASDLMVFFGDKIIRQVCAVIREVRPTILFTHPPQDYMEDHMETCRIALTAAFARGIPNYRSIPQRQPVLDSLTIYHSMPHGLCTPMREPVIPEAFVNVAPVQDLKRAALACHKSQKEWLDASQGMDSYVKTMDELSARVGAMSGRFKHAEGWRTHLHYGYGGADDNPLQAALGNLYLPNRKFKPPTN